MLPLGKIIGLRNIQFHCYADDTQLYVPLRSRDANNLQQTLTCLDDIKCRMSQDYLQLNKTKSEIILIGCPNSICCYQGLLGNISAHIRYSASNLGLIFDSDLSFSSQVTRVVQSCFPQLGNFAKILCHTQTLKRLATLSFLLTSITVMLCTQALLRKSFLTSSKFKIQPQDFKPILKDVTTSLQSLPHFTGCLWVLELILRFYCWLLKNCMAWLPDTFPSFYSLMCPNAFCDPLISASLMSRAFAVRALVHGTPCLWISGELIHCLLLKLVLKLTFT